MCVCVCVCVRVRVRVRVRVCVCVWEPCQHLLVVVLGQQHTLLANADSCFFERVE